MLTHSFSCQPKQPARTRGRPGNPRPAHANHRPQLEQLESRLAPAVFHVDTFADTLAVDLANGKDAAGHVSLRSAVMAANANPGADTIVLSGGNYALAIAGPGEDHAAAGDLDIRGDLHVIGQGSEHTQLDARHIERLFHVHEGSLRLEGMTLTGGTDFVKVAQGSLVLDDVTLVDAGALTAIAEALARQDRDNELAFQEVFANAVADTDPAEANQSTSNEERDPALAARFGVGGCTTEGAHEVRRPDFSNEAPPEPMEGQSRNGVASDPIAALPMEGHDRPSDAESLAVLQAASPEGTQREHTHGDGTHQPFHSASPAEHTAAHAAPLVLNITRLTWHGGPAKSLLLVLVCVQVTRAPTAEPCRRSRRCPLSARTNQRRRQGTARPRRARDPPPSKRIEARSSLILHPMNVP